MSFCTKMTVPKVLHPADPFEWPMSENQGSQSNRRAPGSSKMKQALRPLSTAWILPWMSITRDS